MDNIDSQYFLTLFGEFFSVLPAKIDAYIGIASIRVPPGKWGTRTKYATALLVAHMLSASGGAPGQGSGAGGGAVTQEQVGDVSRSFGQVGDQMSGDAALMTTRYGIDFVALRKETIVPSMVTGPYTAPPFQEPEWPV